MGAALCARLSQLRDEKATATTTKKESGHVGNNAAPTIEHAYALPRGATPGRMLPYVYTWAMAI